MLRTLLLIILGLFLFSCSGRKNTYYFGMPNFSDNVKTLTETNYYASEKFGKPSKDNMSGRSIKTFDKTGHPVEINSYGSSGDLYEKTIFKFDDKGRFIEKNQYSGSGTLRYKIVPKFGDNENEIEENSYSGDGSIAGKMILTYPDHLKQIEFNSYAASGRLDYKVIQYFDDKKKLKGYDIYSSDGSVKTKYSIQYENLDKHGNWQRQTVFANDKVEAITEREIEYY